MKPFDKLKTKLAELFQLDQADLDFGIYRIMNAKREEITRFLEKDLLPQVQSSFQQYQSSDKVEIQKELEKSIKDAQALGVDPDTVPKVKDLRARYESSVVDIAVLENEVYDHLYSFFSRYYDEGDFISMRRYKEGVYAIPYEGEEVKLHWANHDQYYIKTTENFRDYTFKLPDGRSVHFKIVEADTEKDNIKAANGKDRRFILQGDNPISEGNGELIVSFEYRPDPEKRKQDDFNRETATTILAVKGIEPLWVTALTQSWRRADGTISEKTILEKHLSDYTRRNTFDYFIHKDLGKFLRRELDFYIKNEVMHLDDVENESAPRVEQYLSKIKVIRKIAHKIIDFLAQIEDFQKKLWLKKKFVVETNYCVTLDRVPEELYPEIAANDAQREEWVKLFAIDEIHAAVGDLGIPANPEYGVPLTVNFLKANDKLVLDTRFFGAEFKTQLIATFEDFDEQMDGFLIHSENFQALNLLQARYRGQVKCVYIDPPYNAQSSEILYKNNYKHSSWLSLIQDRIQCSKSMLTKIFVYITAIDEVENMRLGLMLSDIFNNCDVATISIVHNPTGQQGNNFSFTHDFAHFIYPSNTNCIGLDNRDDPLRESEPDIRPLRNVSSGKDHLRLSAANCFYPIYVNEGKITGFGHVCEDSFHPEGMNVIRGDGVIEVYPIDPSGIESKWVFARHTVETIIDELSAEYDQRKKTWDIIRRKSKFRYKSLWEDKRYSANSWGSVVLNNILPGNPFTYPKSIYTVRDCVDAGMNNALEGFILDYFAGSGTTGHATINLNREDDGNRKYILVEMGDYFDTVLKPRIQKVVYAKDWKDGKPVSRNTGVSHMFKYLHLESYEDALANLQLRRTPVQQSLLDQSDSFRESYMLSYVLDMETKDSPSLLNIDHFDDPFSYQLHIGTGSVGETKPITVDLVETFNWLLGLKVKHIDHIEGFRIVEGVNPKGEKVLVIWRKIRDLADTDADIIQEARKKANEDLEAFFRKQQYNTMDMEFDVIYVNGDNNLMNLPMAPEGEGLEPRYKVRLIEEEFKRLMFDVKDV